MAIDLIPRRFYTTESENSTLVSRIFVPNCINDTRLEGTSCSEDSESTACRGDTEAPTSPRSNDGNNNAVTRRVHFRKSRRLTSDDYVSTEENILPVGLKTSCEHLADLVAAEIDLEIYGFCNPHIIRGLVPKRFLPSLVTFRDKCGRLKNTPDVPPDIPQLSPTSSVSAPPDIAVLLRQFAARADLELQKQNSKGLETNYTKNYTREFEKDKKQENRIVVCSNCGCYSWAK